MNSLRMWSWNSCAPCRLVSNFHYLVLRDIKKESLLPKMLSGDPSGVLQLQIARCASHSSPCSITTPKIGCSSMLASSLSGMCLCRNVTCMNIKVSSLTACFIVTKENEPLLRRLYAAHSSAFPLVSCGCSPCSGLSQHRDSFSTCSKQHRGKLTVVSWSGLVAAPLWHLPALHGATGGRSE